MPPQYHVYLFETILLCCKDIDLSKPKNKLSNKQLVDKRGKPKLQLKGRIFMQNVTDLISLSKQGKAATSVSALSAFWQLNIVSKEWVRAWIEVLMLIRILVHQAHTHVRSSGRATRASTTLSSDSRPRR